MQIDAHERQQASGVTLSQVQEAFKHWRDAWQSFFNRYPPDVHSLVWLRAIQAVVSEMRVAPDQKSASVLFQIPVLVPETIAEWIRTWVVADRPMPAVQDLGVPVFTVMLKDRPIVRSEVRSEIRAQDGQLTRRRARLVSEPQQIPTSPNKEPVPAFQLRKPRADRGQARTATKPPSNRDKR